jgi:hypothetical protein
VFKDKVLRRVIETKREAVGGEYTIGYNEKAVGYNEKTVGYNEKAVGYNEKTVGYNEKAVGYNEKTVGYNEKAVGYNENFHKLFSAANLRTEQESRDIHKIVVLKLEWEIVLFGMGRIILKLIIDK